MNYSLLLKIMYFMKNCTKLNNGSMDDGLGNCRKNYKMISILLKHQIDNFFLISFSSKNLKANQNFLFMMKYDSITEKNDFNLQTEFHVLLMLVLQHQGSNLY